jgi:hypothetical protein
MAVEAMDAGLREIFEQVEKYLRPLLSRDPYTPLSKDEARVLALQNINRLNQRIGMLARSSKDKMTEMKILQTQVNRLTIGVKTDNVPQIRGSMASVRSYIDTLEKN